MKRLLLGCLVVLATACAQGGSRVRTAPRSDRTRVEPRNGSWLRQDAVALVSNDCAPLAKAFAIDHTDEDKPIEVIPKDAAKTIQMFRPLATGKYGYNFWLKLRTYDLKGVAIESFDAGPFNMETSSSGHQSVITLKPLGDSRCYLEQRQ